MRKEVEDFRSALVDRDVHDAGLVVADAIMAKDWELMKELRLVYLDPDFKSTLSAGMVGVLEGMTQVGRLVVLLAAEKEEA